MSKPTVFFSHSSRDRDVLVHLKELFVEKTNGTIDVFLSSDGESIPFGHNWVHRVEEAMETASLMIVFITPNALRSNWVFFESGFAYAKSIRVVPVGFLGIDLGTVSPPLSLLQGFNINSADGLNNLVALANEKFEHQHAPDFGAAEFHELVSPTLGNSTGAFGQYSPFLEEVSLALAADPDFPSGADEAMAETKTVLHKHEIAFEFDETQLHFHGVSYVRQKDGKNITLKIDPTIASVTFPVVDECIRAIRPHGLRGLEFKFDFVRVVHYLKEHHKVTARLYGSGAGLGESGRLAFRDLEFWLGGGSYYALDFRSRERSRLVQRATNLRVALVHDSLPIDQIGELITLLFRRNILYISDPSGRTADRSA